MRVQLIPGASAVAAVHAEELPQKDELCGAFWGTIALRAAGVKRAGEDPVDQDAVARLAGTILSEVPQLSLPKDEPGRRDYRIKHPVTDDESTSGTSAEGVAVAVEELSDGTLVALPFSGVWTVEVVLGMFETLVALGVPTTVIANVFTGDLWSHETGLRTFFEHLATGAADSAPCDWRVGHFLGLVGTVSGERGTLVVVADTYRSLGWQGWHLQPAERVAAALSRTDGREGGVLIVAPAASADALAERLDRLGLEQRHWSNGSDLLPA
jgi:hypothetical protein